MLKIITKSNPKKRNYFILFKVDPTQNNFDMRPVVERYCPEIKK
jgi:hypothetical protein